MYDASAQNEPILYYTVYFSGYDGLPFCGDLLHEVRKSYFESAHEMKDKGTHDFNGTSIRYSYSMQASRPMKWNITSGLFKILERCIAEKNGSYSIETLDKAGKVSKRTYFSANHIWEETRYYDPSDGLDPIAKIQPWSMGNTLLFTKYDPESGEGLAYDLVPAGEVSDDENAKRINSAAGIPSVWCRTSVGDFYYCRRDEAEKRLRIIKSINSSPRIVQPPVPQRPENTWAPPAPAIGVQVPKVENSYAPLPFEDSSARQNFTSAHEKVDISTMQSGLDEALRRSAIEMERVMHPQHDPVVYAFNPELYSVNEPVGEQDIPEAEEEQQAAATETQENETAENLPDEPPLDVTEETENTYAVEQPEPLPEFNELGESFVDEGLQMKLDPQPNGMPEEDTSAESRVQEFSQGQHYTEEIYAAENTEADRPVLPLQIRQDQTDFSAVDSEIENLFTTIENDIPESIGSSSDAAEAYSDMYSPREEGEPIAYFEEPQDVSAQDAAEISEAEGSSSGQKESTTEEISAQGLILGMGIKSGALQDVRKYSVAGSSMIRPAAEDKITPISENIQQSSSEPSAEVIAMPTSLPTEELPVTQEEQAVEIEHVVEPVQLEVSPADEQAEQVVEPRPYLNSQGQFPYTMQSACGAAAEGCPYSEAPRKKIIIGADETYYYFGDVVAGLREGRGRTVMPNGFTAYEGDYKQDKRSGFGTYYYKSGKICYTGEWKENKRSGTGVSFRPTDGTIHVGRWEEDRPVGMGSRFDQNGNLVFAGQWENGKRQGAGVSYRSEDGRVFIGKWKDDMPAGLGTEFDGEGNLLYTGMWQDGMRHGEGTEYDKNGALLYKGGFSYGMYDGDGVIHLPDGRKIEGHFAAGYVTGTAAEYSADGFKLYEGEWQDGTYGGEGRRYLRSGGWYQGRFEKGLPAGRLSGFNSDSHLCYQGEWDDDLYNGQGCLYSNGDKVYEGHFTDGLYNGQGFEYERGSYVYSGSFTGGVRSGFGTSFKNGKPEYVGMWSENVYNGPGLLYQDGVPLFAGLFSDGKKNGRINEIHQNQIYRECLYQSDRLEYMREYGPGGVPAYEGKVADGLRNGMGCTFTPFGEKFEEGIFEKGRLITRMKVSFTPLKSLQYSEELSQTDYEHFRQAPEFVLEQPLAGGIYSGLVVDGVPNGSGTVLYADHRYTGSFVDGKPCGKGTLYHSDGHTQSGEFTLSMSLSAQRLSFENGVEYFIVKNAADSLPEQKPEHLAAPPSQPATPASADFMKDLYEAWRHAHNI